jgi:hypothetical protein
MSAANQLSLSRLFLLGCACLRATASLRAATTVLSVEN